MRRFRGRIWVGLTAILTAATAFGADEPKVAGDWEGNLAVAPGVELRLVFHIAEKEGKLVATMDSPDQGVNGLKVDSATVKNGEMTLEIKRIGGAYVGKVDPKARAVAGTWSQAGNSFPLNLKPFDPSKVKPLVVPKELEGIWEGKMGVGAGLELRMVLKVTKAPDGTLKAAVRSPDQIDQDFPISSLELEGKTLTVGVKSLASTYSGTLNDAKTEIDGKWKQGGASLPLVLKKTAKESEAKRPQTPKAPFPYESEDVTYENKAGKLKLAGTLTKPKGKGPFPVAILITGSGQQDRDETLFAHKPFLVVADALARRGVAVLRVDDRGVGGSTGAVATATSEDFAGDVFAGITYLKSRSDVDAKRIGLIGHSEGGLIAPLVAKAHPDDVAFIVMLAGTGLNGAEIVKLQSGLILKAMGGPDDAVARQAELMDKLIAIANSEADEEKAKVKLAEAAKAFIASLPKELKEQAGEAGEAGLSRLNMFATPWFRFFLNHEPKTALKGVRCPVLAVNGEKDLQVPPKQNLKAIAEALTEGGNTNFTTKEFPNLNHLFQTCKTGSPAEYAAIEETFAPDALAFVVDWVVGATGAK